MNFELLVDLHINEYRQGPGSDAETLKALSFVDIAQKENLKVADIGCGTGASTICLGKKLNAKITAVDLFSQFLDILKNNAEKAGLNNIETLEASMTELPLEEDSFDILWSEGAIYNMGFTEGIKQWKKYLKKGGYLCVSEITWTTGERSKEINDYWNEAYPEVGTAGEKIKILEDNGYSPVGYFYLDQNSWIEEYYKPLINSFPTFLEKHNHSEDAKLIVAETQAEIDLYMKHKEEYSYGFYVAKRVL
ncbi:class I SAM-dependent methyltransferase [Flammeovirga sp. MY04]|uniref:class I SAM-dependent methyltransferase n=1 Tax=Flammeovirga sp. MY04 TaxID=1191459 RepID=UPI0008063536|nr:class I SAM-dependent methyltransferase [Flammeovirga sp. MY04]ANQ49773.1 class I SAM-dependent methyltransferase [Flammeovirga sp. MY04]